MANYAVRIYAADLKAWIQQEAERRGIQVSDVVEDAVRQVIAIDRRTRTEQRLQGARDPSMDEAMAAVNATTRRDLDRPVDLRPVDPPRKIEPVLIYTSGVDSGPAEDLGF